MWLLCGGFLTDELSDGGTTLLKHIAVCCGVHAGARPNEGDAAHAARRDDDANLDTRGRMANEEAAILLRGNFS